MNPTLVLQKIHVAAVMKACHLPLAWHAAGKLTEYRHPVNNYRLFKLKDVEKLRRLIETPRSTTERPRRPK